MAEFDITTFWDDEQDNPIPGVSDAEIEEAETTLGYKLPPEYAALMKLRNGGRSAYDLPKALFAAGVFGCRFSTLAEVVYYHDAYELETLDIEERLGEVVAIASSYDGHGFVGLDYRDKEVPSVVYINPDEAPIWSEVWGGTFKDFLDALVEFVD